MTVCSVKGVAHSEELTEFSTNSIDSLFSTFLFSKTKRKALKPLCSVQYPAPNSRQKKITDYLADVVEHWTWKKRITSGFCLH